MTDWTLVEACAGTGALTYHLYGAKRAIVPYQGSKWKFRKALAALLEAEGYAGPPRRSLLVDPGPFGWVHQAPLACVADIVDRLATEDPQDLYDRLHGAPVPRLAIEAAAQFLVLQRLAFSGKAVVVRGGRWVSPGLNRTSAYGLPATDRFGAVRPQLPGLAGHLRNLAALNQGRIDGLARPFDPAGVVPRKGRVAVYIDPPYSGTTGYGDAYPRGMVMADARVLAARGALVVVSEAEPLPVPGAVHVQLTGPTYTTSPFKTKRPEWLTILRPL